MKNLLKTAGIVALTSIGINSYSQDTTATAWQEDAIPFKVGRKDYSVNGKTIFSEYSRMSDIQEGNKKIIRKDYYFYENDDDTIVKKVDRDNNGTIDEIYTTTGAKSDIPQFDTKIIFDESKKEKAPKY